MDVIAYVVVSSYDDVELLVVMRICKWLFCVHDGDNAMMMMLRRRMVTMIIMMMMIVPPNSFSHDERLVAPGGSSHPLLLL